MHWKRTLNLWHRKHRGTYALLSDDTSADTAVVFVHGFYGNSSSTWQNFERLILDGRGPESFNQADFYFYAYPSEKQIVEAAGQDLAAFIRWLYPAPAAALYAPSPAVAQVLGVTSVIPRQTLHYKNLVLVGHSLGGVLVRGVTAGSLDWRTVGVSPPLDTESARRTAVALFAPAQFGFRLNDELGRVFSLFPAGEALSVIFTTFLARAYNDLKTMNGSLGALKQLHERLAQTDREARCLQPATLWGYNEIVVNVRDYDGTDLRFGDLRHDHNHTSICKPKAGFDDPLALVRNALERIREPLAPR